MLDKLKSLPGWKLFFILGIPLFLIGQLVTLFVEGDGDWLIQIILTVLMVALVYYSFRRRKNF